MKGHVLSASVVVLSDTLTGIEITSRLDVTPTEYADLGTMDESARVRLRGLIATDQGSVRIEASVTHTRRHRMTFLNDVLQKLADFPGHFWLTAYAGESEE